MSPEPNHSSPDTAILTRVVAGRAASAGGRTRNAARWLEGPPSDEAPPWSPLSDKSEHQPLGGDFRITAEQQQTTVVYVEPNRRVAMQWSANEECGLFLDSIETWCRDDGTTQRVSDEERVEIARRTAQHFRQEWGIRLILK